MVHPESHDYRRALLLGGAALGSIALILIVYMFGVSEPAAPPRLAPPRLAPTSADKVQSEVMPATTASTTLWRAPRLRTSRSTGASKVVNVFTGRV